MLKIVLILLFISSSFSQQIDYNPQFSNLKNNTDLQKGLLSTGILTFTVISIYETGKPIYYNEERSSFHFTRYFYTWYIIFPLYLDIYFTHQITNTFFIYFIFCSIFLSFENLHKVLYNFACAIYIVGNAAKSPITNANAPNITIPHIKKLKTKLVLAQLQLAKFQNHILMVLVDINYLLID